MRRVRVPEPMDRCGWIHAAALSSLLNNEIDGAVRQRTAGQPNGWEHGRERRRIAVGGKEAGGDHLGDQYRPAFSALAGD